MEGGGEGMVAIIRGLQDAGLAVTLTSGELPSSRRASIYAPRTYVPLSAHLSPLTSNEETNTKSRVTANISAQVCDDRYTSSYQVAHCNKRPSSPPVLLPEFPLRKDISKNDSNFQVGWERRGSGELPTRSLRSAGTSTCKASFHYPYRGSPAFDIRASEAFAASLRRYSLSPERSPSAELVQKLLSYTLNKNNATAKAVRSSHKERIESEKRRCKDKDIQTYTRTRPRVKQSGIEESKSKAVKRMRPHSPVKDSRDKRSRDNHINETYDYLKSTSPHYYSKAAEVRYLSNVSRCIKETIKQIVEDEQTEVCSQMQNRYLAHRKRCQHNASISKQNDESCQMQAKEAENAENINSSMGTCLPSCPNVAPPCCYCKKRLSLSRQDSEEDFCRQVSEIIGRWLLDIPTYANMSEEDKQKRIDMVEKLANVIVALKGDEDIEEKAKKEIERCLDNLPMWLPSSKSDKDNFKMLLTDNLMNKLKKIFEGTDKLDDEINKWIDGIKFRSRDSFGEIVDKDKISNMIAERLRPIAIERLDSDDYHDALKNEIVDILKELPIQIVGNKEQFIDNLADKLVKTIKKIPVGEIKPSSSYPEGDEFDKQISQWMNEIKFKKRDSFGEVVDKLKIANIFAEKLKSLALERPEDDDEYHELLKNEIIEILEDLPIEIVGNKVKYVEKLASKLTNTLKNISPSKIQPKSDIIEDMILKWMGDIKFRKKDSQGNVIDKRKIANTLAERLKSIAIDRPEDDEDYHDALKHEIVDILDELPIEIVGKKDQFIDKLASKLTNMIKKIPASEIKSKGDKFDEKISQWMEEIKFKKKDSQGNVIDKRKIADRVAERLKSIAIERPEDDEDYHDALKHEIVDILDELPIEIVGNKDQFIDKLANKLTNMIKKIPASEIKSKGDKFDEKISQWMEEIKFKKKDSQGNVIDKRKIADTVAERLKSIAIERPEDDEDYHDALKHEIVDILDELPIEIVGNKDQFIDKLANKLTNMIKKIPASEIKSKGDKFDEKISQWMEEIKFKKKDSQGNVIDKRKIADTVAERIKSIAIERPEDDEDYHDALKHEIVDILDELPIVIVGNKDQFIDKLASKLTNMIKKIPASEIKQKPIKNDMSNKFQDTIIDWLKEIPELSSVANIKDKSNKKLIEKLENKLKVMQSQGMDEETINKEIQKWMEAVMTEDGGQIDTKMKSQLAKKLIGKLKDTTVSSDKMQKKSDKEQYTEEISEWLENIPELSEVSQSEKNKMIQDLAKKIQKLKSDNALDDDGLQNEIISWLATESEKRGTRIDYRTKDKLANKLAENIFNSVKKERRSSNGKFERLETGRSSEDYKEECSKEIRSWLKNIPELSGSKEHTNIMIENLAQKLQELQSKGIEDKEEIQDEIKDWLLTESQKQGVHFDVKANDDLINQLAGKIAKVKPPLVSSDKIKEKVRMEIWNGLKDIPGIAETENNNKLVQQLAQKVTSISKEHGEKVNDEILKKEVLFWLDDFIDKSGLEMNQKNKNKLANDLTTKIKYILKPNAKHNEMKQNISNEISSVIDNSSSKLSPQEKKNVERRVATLLAKKIDDIDSTDNEKIKKDIVKILDEETDLSPEEAEKLADSFINRAKNISGVRRQSTLKSELPEEIRGVIQKKVKDTLSDFNISNREEIETKIINLLEEQVLNGVDTKMTKKKIMDILQSTNLSKDDVSDLSTRLTLQALDLSSIRDDTDTTLPSEFTLTEKEIFETSAIKDITEFMDEVVGEMDPKYRRKIQSAAQKLAEKLGDAISDPNKTVQDKENILNTEVSNFLESFSIPVDEYGPALIKQLRNIAVTSTPRQSEQSFSFYPRRSSSTLDDNIISTLENAIQNWILDLPVEIGDKVLVRNIVRDLANDIADRQKYLQSHPEIQPSDEEKLEFLRYQIFRAMGKSVEAKDLATIMNQTASLLSQVKKIVSPMLTSPSEEELSNEFSKEISKWVGDIIADIKGEYLENNIRQEIVKELAEKLQNKGKLGQSLDDEIIQWLSRIVKDTNQTNIKDMTDNLKQRLKNKGLIKEVVDGTSQSISDDRIQQDTSQFLEENLSTGISDWLKSLPLYQRRTSKEKRVQEKIVQDMINDIKNLILSDQDNSDLDMQILQTVKNHLEKFPMDKELKSDKAFIEKTAAQLVDYLNNMQLFSDISSRQSIHPLEYLISTVNDWINSIPLETSSDSREIDKLKVDFLNRLNNMLKDSTQKNDQTIRDKIKTFLETLPIHRNKKHDPKYMAKKVEELFNNLLGTPFMSPQSRPTINRDLVESAVQNWSQKLPFLPRQSPKSVSDKIQNFASDISNMLKDTNVTAVDNYKNNLLDKTIDFLKQLPLQSDKLTSEELRKLADDLLTSIKKKADDLAPKSASKNAADTLYDNIATWCDDLPISKGSTPEEKERVKTIKQNLASRLMNKIGELNMNPEIFNDDFLYEDLLQEEIDNLLSGLPPSPEIDKNLESIKENLMTKIREAKQKTVDELAGQTYKQKLRETISKSLPFDVSESSEGPEPFEILVDNLADAYVDLQFTTDSNEQREKYKNKIADEINKYCNEYLKRHPEAPLDSLKINQDLYNALKKIPTPKEDIMRSEAEHVRIKDEINDWLKELPLTKGSGPQEVQKNKMASVLAKKLLEIEKEKDINPEIDYEEKAHKEISKLLKKLPIKPGKEGEIENMIQRLIDRLKSTEQSRRISASTTRQSIDAIPEQSDLTGLSTGSAESSEDRLCPSHRKQKSVPPGKNICRYKSCFPKSTLSSDDRAHLERIRIRTPFPSCRIHRVCSCKDASVNPPPIDTGSQTDVCPNELNICPRLTSRTSPCPAESQLEVSPQVIIKEYLWDSGTSKLLGPVYRLPCVEVDNSNSSIPCLQRKSVSIQPSPCIFPPCPKKSPCSSNLSAAPRPCINLQRSPCPSPCELSTPKPCINLPRTVIPSLPANICANRSVSTEPCEPSPVCPPSPPCKLQEIPYCSTPRRPISRDQNIPFRQPCFQPSFYKPCSPNDTESDAGPSRCFPRVINLGSFDDQPKIPCPSPCQRRRLNGLQDGHHSDYNDCQGYRRKLYRMPGKPCFRDSSNEGRCYKFNNREPRNVCRHRLNNPSQSSENLRQCSKCCGVPCPHPTRLFFR